MENQHRQIKGYRELNQTEIDLMNRIKSFGPQLQELCEDIEKHLDTQRNSAFMGQGVDEIERLDHAEPTTWLFEGKHTLQVGLMKLTRSIAQPGFF